MPDYDALPHSVLRIQQFLRSPICKGRQNETHLKREERPYGK